MHWPQFVHMHLTITTTFYWFKLVTGTSAASSPKICQITAPYFLMVPFYLLRDSSYINKAFSEDNEHAAGSAAQSRRGTVKGSISSAEDNHGSPYRRQWRVTGAHSWMMKGKPHFQAEKPFLHDSSKDTCTQSSVKLHHAVSEDGVSLSNYSASLRHSFIPILKICSSM